MIFHDKYELLALRGGDREIALPGREISSGRDVMVHLLSAGYTAENRDLLASLDALPASSKQRILDKGDHEGIPYVITEVLPAKLSLQEWLKSAAVAAVSPDLEGTGARTGLWKIPVPVISQEIDSPAVKAGEFTRILRAQAEKPVEPARPDAPRPDDLPTAVITVSDAIRNAAPAITEPPAGEFTRILRGPAAPPSADETPTVPVTPIPISAEPEPGEFTRILRGPSSSPVVTETPTVAASLTASPVEPEPGEFTRILRGPAAPPAVIETPGVTAVPSAAADPEPGEFTRILRGPAATSAQPEPGEFTRILRSSPVTPQPASSSPVPDTAAMPVAPPPAQGEFTRMFRTEPAAPLAAAPPAVEPTMTAPPPMRTPQQPGPGEFTRMMQAPLAPEPLRPQPAAPPAARAGGEFTRMMQAGQAAEPPVRQAPIAPPLQTPARGKSPQQPGEFTRMFANDSISSERTMPEAPQNPMPHGGLATGAFSRSAVPVPPPAEQGPSEFTQMFAAPTAAPAAKPPEPKPAPPAVKSSKSALPLVLILGGLFVLVVIVILVFVLMK